MNGTPQNYGNQQPNMTMPQAQGQAEQPRQFNAVPLNKLEAGESILIRSDYVSGRRNFAIWDTQQRKRYKFGDTIYLSGGPVQVDNSIRFSGPDKDRYRRMESFIRKGLILPQNQNMYLTNIAPTVERRIFRVWAGITEEQRQSAFIRIAKYMNDNNQVRYLVELSDEAGKAIDPQWQNSEYQAPTQNMGGYQNQAPQNNPSPNMQVPQQQSAPAKPQVQLNETEQSYVNELKNHKEFSDEQRLMILTQNANIQLDRAQEILKSCF